MGFSHIGGSTDHYYSYKPLESKPADTSPIVEKKAEEEVKKQADSSHGKELIAKMNDVHSNKSETIPNTVTPNPKNPTSQKTQTVVPKIIVYQRSPDVIQSEYKDFRRYQELTKQIHSYGQTIRLLEDKKAGDACLYYDKYAKTFKISQKTEAGTITTTTLDANPMEAYKQIKEAEQSGCRFLDASGNPIPIEKEKRELYLKQTQPLTRPGITVPGQRSFEEVQDDLLKKISKAKPQESKTELRGISAREKEGLEIKNEYNRIFMNRHTHPFFSKDMAKGWLDKNELDPRQGKGLIYQDQVTREYHFYGQLLNPKDNKKIEISQSLGSKDPIEAYAKLDEIYQNARKEGLEFNMVMFQDTTKDTIDSTRNAARAYIHHHNHGLLSKEEASKGLENNQGRIYQDSTSKKYMLCHCKIEHGKPTVKTTTLANEKDYENAYVNLLTYTNKNVGFNLLPFTKINK